MIILPDNSLPPASVSPRRRSPHNTPGWVAGLALTFVVVCVILRTALATRDTGSKDETESVEKTFMAVQITKTAYAMSRLPDSAPAPGKAGRFASPSHFADDALADWRTITHSTFAHTADWRRLALTLSLFDRPGIPEALGHIAAARAVDDARLSKQKSRTARSRRAQAAEVPVAEEIVLWKALYSARPIAANRVAALRTVIGRLNLGWFEHAALAQLYTRAGQKPQAVQEQQAAYRSAALIVGFNSFELGLLMLGSVGLLMFGLLFLLNRVSRQSPAAEYASVAAPYPARVSAPPSYAIPAVLPLPFAPPMSPVAVAERIASPPLAFSYRARTIAFSVYMAVFMLIGFPLRLLRPFVESWSSGAVTRLITVLEIVIYVPVVLIALWTLRRLAAAESASPTLPTWRETFTALGMTSRRPMADIGVGTLNYVLLMPLFFAMTAFSHRLFQHYHTPINPVQFDSMMAQNNVDRLLLLLVTAVAAPIVEELMFRGVLYPALKNSWGRIGGAAFSAAVFAIVHPTIPDGFLPIMLLGFAFALTYERRGSLLPNNVMHGIHNGLILLTVFFLFAR
jgi:membrane protease YdiL (CAAX protease family)